MDKSLPLKDKTLFLAINQGFAFRYFLQTDIFRNLHESGAKIVLIVPKPEDEFFKKYREMENLCVEKYEMDRCSSYFKQSFLQPWLSKFRLFTLNGKHDITTVRDKEIMYFTEHEKNFQKGKVWFLSRVLKGMVFLGRKFSLIRSWMLKLECALFNPRFHKALFEKYNPDLLILCSLGTFDWDQYWLREAKTEKVKTLSVILSWDNTTTRGMPGGFPDHVITWTEVMKKETVLLNDLPAKKVSVGGVAHFDHYYNEETFYSKEEFCEKMGLDPNKKILFFVTRSPNGFPWNVEITEDILKAIEENSFHEKCQLVVRLHPIYYRKEGEGFKFQSFLDQYYQFKEEHPGFVLNEPLFSSQKMNYTMPESEIKVLASLLKYSDVVINSFSTLNIEAALFDKPIINICFEGDRYKGPKKARYNIAMDERKNHNARIASSDSTFLARSKEEMMKAINEALAQPELRKEERQKVKGDECGPNPGRAGETIAKIIIEQGLSEN